MISRIRRRSKVVTSTGLAQSFFVRDSGGIYISAISLYFSQVVENSTVIVDIRPVQGNFGSEKKPSGLVLPFSKLAFTPSLSTSKVEFEAPIYLSEGQEYCFTVYSKESGNKMKFARIGDLDTDTNTRITRGKNIGFMYKKIDNKWEKDSNNLISFFFERCRFDTSGSIVLNELNNNHTRLPENPFLTTEKSNIVRVLHPNNGFLGIQGDGTVRSRVTLQTPYFNSLTGSQNGITYDELKGTHDIIDAEPDSYSIRVSSTANASGRFGTDVWLATTNHIVNSYRPLIGSKTPSNTNMTLSSKLTNFASTNDDSNALVIDTEYTEIDQNSTIETTFPKVILNNETANLQTIDSSVELKYDLESTRNNLSPIIELDKCFIVANSNQINNPAEIKRLNLSSNASSGTSVLTFASTTGLSEGFIVRGKNITDTTTISTLTATEVTLSEPLSGDVESGMEVWFIDPLNGFDYTYDYAAGEVKIGSSSKAKYITKEVELEIPANTVKVIFESLRPTETNIEVYVKVKTPNDIDKNFEDIPWTRVLLPNNAQIPFASVNLLRNGFVTRELSRNRFSRNEFTFDSTDSFSSFAVKLEFKSENSSKFPLIRNFKGIALT